jgi:polyisoprenoid-binding protein YceI
MTPKFFYLLILMVISTNVDAQKYFTREGKVSFFSEAPLEKIEAHNSKATSVIDITSGRMEFAILIKAFQFEKALMQEHFNENYMESDKYPKATFKGNITDIDVIDLTKDGEYEVNVKGDLTIHGETKTIETPGKIIVKDGQISANANFEALVEDYKIEIPAIVKDNIAKTVRIDIAVNYEELN